MAEPLAGLQIGPCPLVEDVRGWVEPLDALAALAGQHHRVLLLSGLDGHPASRYSILAADPLLVLTLRGREGKVDWAPGSGRGVGLRVVGDPFDLVRAIAPGPAPWRVEGTPFAGGLIGYLGYGLRRCIERLPGSLPERPRLPEAWFGLYDAAVLFDHVERRVIIHSVGMLPDGEPHAGRAVARLADLRSALRRAGDPPRPPVAGTDGRRREARLVMSPADYRARITRALEHIAAGDVYQVNLSHRIECPFEDDPVALFRRLASRNPAPFAAYLDAGRFQVVSASPERFVSLRKGVATSSPIKGTRPRHPVRQKDRKLAGDLVRSAKDRAENVMIADLVRNDLGRVSEVGSVRVESLCALESFATVHHLVSTVCGRLRADRDRVDLLRALFPGGSMTGAPKVRAMEVIDELETEERGVYAGGLGYLSLDGSADFSIVIRTVVCAAGRAHLRVGGAIVAEPDPEGEFLETLDKAHGVLDALGADLRNAAGR